MPQLMGVKLLNTWGCGKAEWEPLKRTLQTERVVDNSSGRMLPPVTHKGAGADPEVPEMKAGRRARAVRATA